MKILSVTAKFFHADGQTNGQDKFNSRFSQYCESAYKQMALILLLREAKSLAVFPICNKASLQF